MVITADAPYPLNYLFLRTKISVAYSDEAFKTLCEAFLQSTMSYRITGRILLINGITWDNGIVLGVHHFWTPKEIATNLSNALANFEAWAIHRRSQRYAEYPDIGLMESAVMRGPFAQLFIHFNESDHDQDSTTTAIMESIPHTATPVFHFRDGKILFVTTPEPARVLSRRSEKALKKLDGWAVCDTSEESASAIGPDESMWQLIDLDDPAEFAFGND